MGDRSLRFPGNQGRAVAMPLGGIGTGQVALRADGRLAQWQIGNHINHRAVLPDTFFALRTSSMGAAGDTVMARRLLFTDPPAEPGEPPSDSTDWMAWPAPFADVGWPTMAGVEMSASYPFATLDYQDDALPVGVQLQAFSPFIPTDDAASSMPIVEYRFEVTSRATIPLYGFLTFVHQNAVGWDGVSPIQATSVAGYGGNVNRLVTAGAATAIVMDNPTLRDDDVDAGEIAIWTDSPCFPLARITSPAAALRASEALTLLNAAGSGTWSDLQLRDDLATLTPPVRVGQGPSPAGSTWDAALVAAWVLQPGQSTAVRFLQSWRFANRQVDFHQFDVQRGPAGGRMWVGNHYATRYTGALQVIEEFQRDEQRLRGASRAWADLAQATSLPDPVARQLHLQPSMLRTPTTFRTADGRFWGHEGSLGASTANWAGDVGGSCPVNCNHVWNYEQTVSRLFPALQRSMRDTEWSIQAAEGYLPHRVVLPLWLPQYHGRTIGGPAEPALDGMLGAILKTYREAQQGGGIAYLEQHWPAVRRLFEYIEARWHTQGDGILRGAQPTTFDRPLTGANMFIGSLWLAALRAVAKGAGIVGDTSMSGVAADLSATAAAGYDTLLWNGEYYEQVDPAPEADYGSGCLTDQLVGQWWAHQLGFGHVLPADHVTTALRSILRYNDRRPADRQVHGPRSFADAGDGGLVNCSWPRGGRPEQPVLYCDESWSGSEYQLAGHLLMEGLTEEALALLNAVHARHDGTRRNPFNEIECGDHYVRAMSGWAAVEAASGYRYDAIGKEISVSTGSGIVPFVAGTAWGRLSTEPDGAELHVLHGHLELDTIRFAGISHEVRRTLGSGDVVRVRA